MGTNFYWIKSPKEFKGNSILQHIGKRSVAGYYCDKCGISFCKSGTQSIHFSDIADWYTECPVCGRKGILVCSFTYTSMKQKEIIKKLIAVDKKLIKDEYDIEYTPKEFLLDALSNTKIEYQMYAEFC